MVGEKEASHIWPKSQRLNWIWPQMTKKKNKQFTHQAQERIASNDESRKDWIQYWNLVMVREMNDIDRVLCSFTDWEFIKDDVIIIKQKGEQTLNKFKRNEQ